MADVSTMTLPNGDVVNIKDSAGREAATTGLSGKVDKAQGVQNQGKILKVGSSGVLELVEDSVGTGDVVGPSSSTDDHVATFDGTTGKLIQDSGFTIGKSVPADAVFTDTTYDSLEPEAGGTDESLVTTGEKATWNAKADMSDIPDVSGFYTKPSTGIPASDLASGVIPDISGKADLDENGKVPSSQLPSYVDDVLEYASLSNFPLTGESGKIYIAQDTNKTYRWSGSAYAEISESLALGETSSTAYRGDRGAAAYAAAVTNVDSTPTANSSHLVTSGGVAAAIPDVSGFYTKPATGIPATDMADGVIPDVSGKLDANQGSGNAGKILKVGNDGTVTPETIQTGSGDVVGPSSATDAHVATFDGTTGKAIKDSGYTIGTSVPANAVFTDTTYNNATQSAAGLMSAADKTKLDGVATGATANTIENSLSSTSTTNGLSAAKGKELYELINGSPKMDSGTSANNAPYGTVAVLSDHTSDLPINGWGALTTYRLHTWDNYKLQHLIPLAGNELYIRTMQDNVWGSWTKIGTITGITMNGASKGTSGVVDLGTVLTAHQDISGKLSGKMVSIDTTNYTWANLLADDSSKTIFFTNWYDSTNFPSVYGSGIKFYAADSSQILFYYMSYTGGAWIRSIYPNSSDSGWQSIITSGNIGSQSVNYATSAGSATDSTKLVKSSDDYIVSNIAGVKSKLLEIANGMVSGEAKIVRIVHTDNSDTASMIPHCRYEGLLYYLYPGYIAWFAGGWGGDSVSFSHDGTIWEVKKNIDSGNIGTQSVAYANSASSATNAANAYALNGLGDSAFVKTDQTASISSIEFKPGASSNVGGYLDFHYNNSSSDFTSRIIEGSSGTLSVNGVNFSDSKINGYTITKVTSLDANTVTGDGIWVAYAYTNAPESCHAVFMNFDSVGTPFQLFFPDYRNEVWKRSKSSGAWGSWTQMKAGIADSVAWTGVSGRPTNVSAFTNDSGYLTSHQDISGKVNKTGDTLTGWLYSSGGFESKFNGSATKAQMFGDWGYGCIRLFSPSGAETTINRGGDDYFGIISYDTNGNAHYPLSYTLSSDQNWAGQYVSSGNVWGGNGAYNLFDANSNASNAQSRCSTLETKTSNIMKTFGSYATSGSYTILGPSGFLGFTVFAQIASGFTSFYVPGSGHMDLYHSGLPSGFTADVGIGNNEYTLIVTRTGGTAFQITGIVFTL